MTAELRWSPEALAALGLTTDVATAAKVIGISRGLAYESIKAGTFPARVLTLGRRRLVVVASLLEALGVPVEGAP